MTEGLTPDQMRRLRRIAHEAQQTYVGTHWPSMEEMRRDGIGHGLIEDRKHDPAIRRFLSTFCPEFVRDLLDMLDTFQKESGHGFYYAKQGTNEDD